MRYLLCIFFALLALGCGDPKAGGVDSHSHQGGQAGESEHAHDGEHGEQDHEREQGEHEEGFVTLTEAQRKEVGLETSVPQEARAQSAPRTGRVEADPDRRVIVSPQVEGTVKHLPIIIGSQVHRGDTLAVLDSPEIVELMGEYHNAQVEVDLASKELRNTESLLSLGDESRREVEEAELQLAEATARRDAVQARLESARLAHERLRTLRAEGIASSQQVEEALANRSALEAELRQASTAITIARQHLERERRVSGSQLRRKAETFPAEATLARARENLKHLEERLLQLGASLEEDGGVILTSPIDGQVIARPVTRGQMVKAGDTVAELVDPSQVWVIIDLVRADLGSVKVSISTFYNRMELVERTLHTVSKNLVEGAVLVVIVLFVFLGDIRAALVVSSIIPFSFLFAATLMVRTGVSGNLMSLGALDFGLIVDGAVVMTEHTVAALALMSAKGSMSERVGRACRDMARPMVFGLGIIVAVYLPLLALTGLEGKMFRPMALTVVYALLGSMILSFTLVPVLLSLVLKKEQDHRLPWIVRLVNPLYQSVLDRVLAFPKLTVLAALLPLGVSILWATRLGAVFLPELDEGSLALQAIRIPSVSLSTSLVGTERIEKALKEFPEVVSVVSKTGRPDLATDPMGVEISDIIVTLKPPAEWSVSSKEELVSLMRERLEAIPGINFSFSQPIELRVEELISGSRSDVALQIFGEDLEEMAGLGSKLVARLQELPGAQDVALEAIGGVPYLQLEVDRTAASRYGIPPSEVLDIIAILFGQQTLSTVLEGERRFPVVATLPKAYLATPEALTSLRISTPSGAYIPLSAVVKTVAEPGMAQVNRVNGQRRAVISMNYDGEDLVGFVERAREVTAEVLPPGVVTQWGGEFQNYERAKGRLAILVPSVMAGILCLLWMNLGRVAWALVIFLNVPFAAVGGVIALGLRGMPFSISAGVGFLTLFGVAVLNGLVLMAAVQEESQRGGAWLEIVRRAAESRLRPVLMTALVASLGFLPMALASGSGAEVQKPLATVVIGGLISSTLLTLALLPSLLSLLPGKAEQKAPTGDAPRSGPLIDV